MPAGSIEDHRLDEFRDALEVNAVSTFVLAQAAARHMERGASVIINTSVQALQGHRGKLGYQASKGALVAMTRSMAADLAPRGIRVNAIAPGSIDTPLFRGYLASVEDADAEMRETVRQHPLGRIGRAEEVASAVLFLASDEASFITGVVDEALDDERPPFERMGEQLAHGDRRDGCAGAAFGTIPGPRARADPPGSRAR